MNRRESLKYALQTLGVPIVAGSTAAAFVNAMHRITAPTPEMQSATFDITIKDAKQSIGNERNVFTVSAAAIVGGTTFLATDFINEIKTNDEPEIKSSTSSHGNTPSVS